MKRIGMVGVSVLTMLVSLSAFATEYFVDDVNGKDTYNGLYETDQKDGINGPKKTLKGAMEIEGLAADDIVTVLPGVYDELTMSQWNDAHTVETLNRVIIPAGVTVRSKEGAQKTFIVGAPATSPVWAAGGCGTDSVRCVAMGLKAKLIGFTVTGGRARYVSDSSCANGGGIAVPWEATLNDVKKARQNTASIVDCVISNNYAYSAGGGYGGYYLRCLVADNKCKSTGPGLRGNFTLIVDNSVVANHEGCYHIWGATDVRNTTVIAPDTAWTVLFGGDSRCGNMYDCVIKCKDPWGGSLKLHHCAVVSTAKNVDDNLASTSYCPEQDCIKLSAEEMGINADYSLAKGSKLIDIGSNTYYYATENLDFNKNPRLLNGRIDLGASEYDWRGDFAAGLDLTGDLAVKDATAMVVTNAAGGLRLLPATTGATSMSNVWKHVASFAQTTYSFKACVEGTGTLAAYADGAAEPYRTLTAADGEQVVSTASANDLVLRLVYTPGADDAAGAVVRDFCNAAKATVTAAQGGIKLTGDVTATGTVVVPAGTVAHFNVARAFDSADRYATGVTSNGVFFSFEDYPNGLDFAVDGNNPFDTLIVEVAGYQAGPFTTWYVDAVNGNDTNYGYHPKNARKTLKAAMEISGLASGHKVFALPGTYDKETMSVSGSTVLNRVVVPSGVTLKSTEGPEKTFIVGATATDPFWEGCGTDSVRCVYLNAKSDEKNHAKLEGFTLTGGHAQMTSASAGSAGGGCVGSTAGGTWQYPEKAVRFVDCIISNNYAYGAAGGTAGYYIRCRVVNNTTKPKSGTAANNRSAAGIENYLWIWIEDSVIADNVGGSQAKDFNEIRCSTVANTQDSELLLNCGDGRMGAVYGSVLIGSASRNTALNLHRCAVSSGMTGIDLTSTTMCPEQDCLSLTLDEMALDANFVPAKTSPLVDAGSNTYHITENAYDVGGTPRRLNVRIDIGGREHDWRMDYSSDLNARYVTVLDATADVVETNEGKVRLADGETLHMRVTGEEKIGLIFPLTITGAGTLTVTCGDAILATLTAADSQCEFKSAATEEELVFSFAGEGTADLGKSKSNKGLAILVR